MSFTFRAQAPRPAAPTSKGGPIFAVGSRATIAAGPGTSKSVALRDHADHETVGTVAHGTEVEILAWQPHRSNGTRYRVKSARDQAEGWVGAARLLPRPRPVPAPVVKPPVAATPPAAPQRKPARAAVRPRAAATKTAAGPARAVATKTARGPARAAAPTRKRS